MHVRHRLIYVTLGAILLLGDVGLWMDASAQVAPQSQIAFYSLWDQIAEPRDEEIYVMDADGANVRNLTNFPLVTDGVPVWSPDGQRIAFASSRDGNGEIWFFRVFRDRNQPVIGIGNTRFRNRSNPARPYICRLISFRRLI